MISWESLYISNLVADKVRARSNPSSIASYLASLLEAGNPSRIACSICSSIGDCKRRPISDPKTLDAQSTWSIHYLYLRESESCDGF